MTTKTTIVQTIVHKPWRSLLFGLCVFFALGYGAQSLKPDFSYRVWFNEGDGLLVEFDTFERRFGNDDRAVVIVHSPSGILTRTQPNS